MTTSVIKFFTKRELSEAQLKRIQSHKPSVYVNADGSLDTNIRTIITPKGLLKEVSFKTIRPNQTERVMAVSDAREVFDELKHINLILTNACNLSCSYCYEQHDKDYGRFTPDTLKTVYDFQLNSNQLDGKLFQFFGGEPLIHKQLILDFIDKYHVELQQNINRIHVSMITNGILLTPDFINKYFQHEFVNMSVSLDTFDADVDHREIGQDKINHIINMIGEIPEYHKKNHMVSVRCTIAVENASTLVEFATKLYDKGLRAMVIHPLTMSSVNGFMSWPTDKWDRLHQDILHIINRFPDFEVQFSEGVGVRGGANCMVGADMIAVDASGDYSGCYFFTNQKENASHTILGNILNDAVYVDRYMSFQNAYDEMFVTEPQCISCDLKGFCYQCPAGNSDNGRGQLFRPDDMCQKIVRLFIDLQDDIVKKSFSQKLQQLVSAVQQYGEQYVFSKAITHLMYKHITGVHIPVGEVDPIINDLPPYQEIIGRFWNLIESNATELPCACDYVPNIVEQPLTVKQFYEKLLTQQGKSIAASTNVTVDDINKRTFYLALLHMVILNQKGESIDKPIRIIKL